MAGKVGHFEACCKTKKRKKEGMPSRDSGQFWGNTQSLRDTAKRADRKAAIKEKFPKVFHRLGKLKGFQLKLHINTNLQPVSKQVRQIPFSTRAKVNEKLDELLKFDRIEKVEWPTSGVNPLVVVEKPNRDIRIWLDMRQANQATVRESTLFSHWKRHSKRCPMLRFSHSWI